MSTKKRLYEALKARILDNTDIDHFLLYNSQFDEMDGEQTFAFPCAFLEFSQLDWQVQGAGRQQADVIVRFHIGYSSIQYEDLEIFDLMEAIHVQLQSYFETDLFTPMVRVSETQDTNHDNVVVWMLDYSTMLIDDSANTRNRLTLTQLSALQVDGDGDPPRLGQINS